MLTYLFHRIEGRLDGRPTLLIIDEGWLVLDDPAFAQQLREWLKTLRKKNASVVFATQSLSDIDASAIAPAIVESCPTRIFLPNERAIEPQITAIYRRFGLNDRQIEIIARATPKRDYYCQSRRGNRLFELGLGPVALAFCAASVARPTTPRSSSFSAEHGRDGLRRRLARRPRPRLGRRSHPHLHEPGDLDYERSQAFPRRRCAVALRVGVVAHGDDAGRRAQLIVFDPNNYAQNLLTAARELQQINNQIQMLTTRPRCWPTRPQPGEPADVDPDPAASSIARTRTAARPGAAHRLRRPADRDQLIRQLWRGAGVWVEHRADAAAPDPLAELGAAPSRTRLKVQAGVGRQHPDQRQRDDPWSRPASRRRGALQAAQAGNQLLALCSPSRSPTSIAVLAAKGRADALEQARAASPSPRARPVQGLLDPLRLHAGDGHDVRRN